MINHNLVRVKLCVSLCLCEFVIKVYNHKGSKTLIFTKKFENYKNEF